MARIRTIKPDFWTDDVIAGLEPVAMLLFIGMWNFADDDGYLKDSVGQLRRQIFPDRGIDIAGAFEQLVDTGRVVRMDSDQGPILSIPHFTEHQKISHPTPTKFTSIRPAGQTPDASGDFRSVPESSALKEGKEGNGMELKGRDAHDLPEPPTRCQQHLNSASPPKCGLCKEARLTHEAWEKSRLAARPPRQVKHIPGLCDAHRQREGECEMCERESREVAEVIYGQFGAVSA